MSLRSTNRPRSAIGGNACAAHARAIGSTGRHGRHHGDAGPHRVGDGFHGRHDLFRQGRRIGDRTTAAVLHQVAPGYRPLRSESPRPPADQSRVACARSHSPRRFVEVHWAHGHRLIRVATAVVRSCALIAASALNLSRESCGMGDSSRARKSAARWPVLISA